MSEINTGGPAFPVQDPKAIGRIAAAKVRAKHRGKPPKSEVWDQDYYAFSDEVASGMTLRDYFAAKAMQAALSGVEHEDSRGELHSMSTDWYDCHAAHAYAMADAMLKAREGGQA